MTFVLLALLAGWWTVLISRLIEENHDLLVGIHGPSAELQARYTRTRVMLLGESATMSLLALMLVGLAWRAVRIEQAGMLRIEGVLAASTHELKTPVAGVRVLLESLQNGVLPAEAAGPYLAAGLASCDRLEHLIEALLAYQAALARPDPALSARPLSDWLEPVLAHRRADGIVDPVDVDLGEAGASPVWASADAFRVVIENLLDNARKYGGAAPVRVRAQLDGSVAILEVMDEGDGFESGLAEGLFEPYQRGEAHSTRHGSGLGLYLARLLARGLGGELRARSEGPGKGAVFSLSLRRADG